MVTMTVHRGLNIAEKSGPLRAMHQACTKKEIPDPTTPCPKKKKKRGKKSHEHIVRFDSIKMITTGCGWNYYPSIVFDTLLGGDDGHRYNPVR